MNTATYIGDPGDDNSGKARIVMKKPFTRNEKGRKVALFPSTGVVFPMNKPVEVTDAQYAFLSRHSHFEVDPPVDETEPENPEEGLETEGETEGEGDE